MGMLQVPVNSLLVLCLALRGMRTRQEGGILPFSLPIKLLAYEQDSSAGISTCGSGVLVRDYPGLMAKIKPVVVAATNKVRRPAQSQKV